MNHSEFVADRYLCVHILSNICVVGVRPTLALLTYFMEINLNGNVSNKKTLNSIMFNYFWE